MRCESGSVNSSGARELLRALSTTQWLPFALLLAISGCDSVLGPTLDESSAYIIDVSSLDLAPRRIWGLTIADFDHDGDDDILVAGHGRKSSDRIYYYRDGYYEPSSYALPRSPDRHGCAEGDANSDGLLDIYCTAGAGRGRGGNANELLLAEADGVSYKKITTHFGAEDPSGRGRLATFLRADKNELEDLFVTVWGEREDGLVNQGGLYLNQGDGFAFREDGWAGKWGSRCLAKADFNGDGLDELVVCGEGEGAFLLSGSSTTPRAQVLPYAQEWWLAVVAADTSGSVQPDLAALVLDQIGGSLQLYDTEALIRGLAPHQSIGVPAIRIPLLAVPTWRAALCIPAALAVGDVSGDQHNDLFITRASRIEDIGGCGDVPDLILLGPDYTRYLALPKSEPHNASQAYFANGAFIRVTAGAGWEGIIEILQVSPLSRDRSASE